VVRERAYPSYHESAQNVLNLERVFEECKVMGHGGEIGFVASALVLIAFGMKDVVNLRIVAICSNFAFIAYALMLNLPPILVLHAILLPLNGWRLAQWQQSHRELGGTAKSASL
jgi:hypothetical protein